MFSPDVFKGRVKFNEPMKTHTSLGIGGPADVFASPGDVASLTHVIKSSLRDGIAFIPLGKGTNVLVKDGGINGVVVSLSSFKEMEVKGSADEVNIEAGAGVPLQRLILLSKKEGLTGMEGLIGIPGTLGGAIAGNAGAFGFEIKDVLVELVVLLGRGDVRRISANEIRFGYRGADLSQGSIILSAVMRLRRNDPETVSKRIEHFMQRKRESQPLSERSAGCVFKNPSDSTPAGRLIEEAGCKGMMVGGVEVSALHANFFIAKENSTAEDFLRLMELVMRRVKDISGIVLEPELRIIGC